MKVKELIQELSNYNREYEIVLQKDPEGNGYSPLVGVAKGMYVEENGWSGEFYDEEDAEDYEIEYEENVVVMWPVN